MDLVSSKVGVDAVEVGLVLDPVAQVFALSEDVTEVVVAPGREPVGSDYVAGLPRGTWKDSRLVERATFFVLVMIDFRFSLFCFHHKVFRCSFFLFG